MLFQVNKQLQTQGMSLEVTTEVKELLAKEGWDPNYGARPLRRLVQTAIGDRLAKEILSGEIKDGDTVRVDAFGDGLIVGPATGKTL